jgi:hypothetical protein
MQCFSNRCSGVESLDVGWELVFDDLVLVLLLASLFSVGICLESVGGARGCWSWWIEEEAIVYNVEVHILKKYTAFCSTRKF